MNDNFKNKAAELAQISGRDVYYYIGPIEPGGADELILQMCNRDTYSEEAYFLITTNGGDPDSAYRMARTLQEKYKRIIMLVAGWCKSAGTLIALGVQEIAMSDMAEFGPLDIQLLKDDEVNANNRTSGNDLLQALSSLHGQAMAMYKSTFDDLINHSHGLMTTRTASEIAKNMVIGLLSPIYAQVEPIRMGAIARSNVIALSYGMRLGQDFQVVNYLITQYPSHGFVIDRKEAKMIFQNRVVRGLDAHEEVFVSGLEKLLRYPSPTPQVGLLCCSTEGQNGQHVGSTEQQPNNAGDELEQNGAGDGEEFTEPVPRGSRKGKTVQ